MKRRILVVDDEPDFTEMFKLSLEALGHYEVCEENDPTKALNTARGFEPDVIVLDVMMPELDGSEVAALLLADKQLKHIPVLFLTALVSRTESRDPNFGMGRRHYLPKPVDFASLIQHIEACCGNKRN